MLDLGMDVQEAGDAARAVHSVDAQPTGGTLTDGGTLYMEAGIPESVAAAPGGMDHRVVHGERRYDGAAAGYWSELPCRLVPAYGVRLRYHPRG